MSKHKQLQALKALEEVMRTYFIQLESFAPISILITVPKESGRYRHVVDRNADNIASSWDIGKVIRVLEDEPDHETKD